MSKLSDLIVKVVGEKPSGDNWTEEFFTSLKESGKILFVYPDFIEYPIILKQISQEDHKELKKKVKASSNEATTEQCIEFTMLAHIVSPAPANINFLFQEYPSIKMQLAKFFLAMSEGDRDVTPFRIRFE